MSRSPRILIVAVGLSAAAAAAPTDGTTTLVTVDTGGASAAANSFSPSVSDGGRVVAFHSAAATLVAGDTNGVIDAFARDMTTGTTVRVSVSSAGVQGDGDSSFPSISANGRYVAFESFATGLVPGDTNSVRDVFVHDRVTGATVRASLGTGSVESNGGCGWASISAGGDLVAFESTAGNLVPGDGNGTYDVFVRDLGEDTLVRVSVSSSGAEGNAQSRRPSLSADGRFVAFESDATNLDPLGVEGVFVHELATGVTRLVSTNILGQPAIDTGPTGSAAISGDGRWVAFMSWADGLVPVDSYNGPDVFLKDTATGQVWLASQSSSGQFSAFAGEPAISADGRYVAFDLGFTGRLVYRFDRELGYAEPASIPAGGGTPDSRTRNAAISPDGTVVAFESGAQNILPEDTDVFFDVFTRDCPFQGVETYCVAEENSRGCVPFVESFGSPSVSGTGFDVDAYNVLNQKFGVLFYGRNGTQMVPFLSGMLCVRSPVTRTSLQNSGGNQPPDDCSGSFTVDFQGLVLSGADPGLTVGERVWAQYWSRDGGAPFGTNLSDAITFEILP